MPKQKIIGLLGGTFDPIHTGHLYIAESTLNTLKLDEIQFIPCYLPPHRESFASPKDRVAMVKLAINNNPAFNINEIELQRKGPSYAIDTLRSLSNENTLCFILGSDGFQKFDHWHHWQNILNYCHLIVVNRPHYSLTLSPQLKEYFQNHRTFDVDQLKQQKNGLIYTLDVPPKDVSATKIRNAIAHDNDVNKVLPKAVKDYILNNQLYARQSGRMKSLKK